MHLTLQEATGLAKSIVLSDRPAGVEVVLGTPALYLRPVVLAAGSAPDIHIAAQNCHQEDQGAYTGEISAPMVRSVGADMVILGHSERRELFGETDELVERKIRKVLGAGLQVIFCCGEPLEEREADRQEIWVENQLRKALFSLSAEQLSRIIIAYEPIWAIGTGKTATPQQAQQMHHFIRGAVEEAFDAELAEKIPILYGGSVKPGNARELFSQPDVDGGLVGGASLKAAGFVDIIHAFPND